MLIAALGTLLTAEQVVRLVLAYVENRNAFMARGGHTAPTHAALRALEALDPAELAALLTSGSPAEQVALNREQEAEEAMWRGY